MKNLHRGDDSRQDSYETRLEAGRRLGAAWFIAWTAVSKIEVENLQVCPSLRVAMLNLAYAIDAQEVNLAEHRDNAEAQEWAIHLYDDLSEALRKIGATREPFDYEAVTAFCDEWIEYFATLTAEVA